LAAGVDGLESDVWLTSDGVPVLHHDGVFGPAQRRSVARTHSADLPAWLPTLHGLYEACGNGFELSLDIKVPTVSLRAAVQAVLAAGRAAGGAAAVRRMWLCGGSIDALRMWRELDDEVRLVNSTSLRAAESAHGLDRYASMLVAAGVDVLNIRAREWTERSAATVRVLHECGLLAFGWGAQRSQTLSRLRRLGVDGAYSDHVARLVRIIREPHSDDDGRR
jgi:glycerophosphoryl diester phosphodiesterase